MKNRAFTLVELLVVIAIIALLMGLLMPALARARQLAYRINCGSNLAGINKALMVYAHENDQHLPKAGGRSNVWMDTIPDWKAATRKLAFGLQDKGGQGTASVSSNLFLLVKHTEVTPKQFNCRGQSGVREFKIGEATGVKPNMELHQVWDFGPVVDENENPSCYNSYAYHAPFGRYVLTTYREPTLAVVGDANPWLISGRELIEGKSWMDFIPDQGDEYLAKGGNADSARVGNSEAHGGRGSNIAFLDGHVTFTKRSWVGVDQDNIYTYSMGREDDYKGIPPFLYDYDDRYVKNKRDAVLMQDSRGGDCEDGVCLLP